MSATIKLPFANDEREFRFEYRHYGELEATFGVGVPVILNRLLSNEWTTKHVREVIRLGLLGGGMPAELVAALIKEHVEDGALIPAASVAAMALLRALSGVHEPGKAEASGQARQEATTGSTSPPFTAVVP